jgi:hypothetical protein
MTTAGYPHADTGKPRKLNSFEDMLETWNGDVIEVTLTTGKAYAGQLQMSHDGVTAWITGKWKTMPTASEPKLYNMEDEVGVRVDHIIAIEYIKEVE